MPHLIKSQDGTWVAAGTVTEADSAQNWLDDQAWQASDPVLLSADAEPTEALVAAEAIAIEFPAFNDGRGLSLAVLLRTRFNFTGELRAVGAVHEDILHYIVRCGFDVIELPDERNIDTALACLEPYTGVYQGSVISPEPAYRRVNRGT